MKVDWWIGRLVDWYHLPNLPTYQTTNLPTPFDSPFEPDIMKSMRV